MDNNKLQKNIDAIKKAEDHISQSIQKTCESIKTAGDEILCEVQKAFAKFSQQR